MSVTSHELANEARAVLAPFLNRLAAKPEVEGVVLLSGMALTGQRVTFDEMSDVDMTVWIRAGMSSDEWHTDPRATRRRLANRLPRWLGNFSFFVPVAWGRVEMNVHQRIFEYDADPRTSWDEGMREAHAYTADIVFDRNGEVARLIAAKTRMTSSERFERLVRLANRLGWDIRRSPERMVRRGDLATGHYMLSAAIDQVIETYYVLAGRFVPHRKWRLDGLLRYGLATQAEVDLLKEAIQTSDLTENEFRRRVTVLEQLWGGLRRQLPREIPDDAYRYYSAHVSANRQLLRHTVADEVLAAHGSTTGPGVFDLANFLLIDDADAFDAIAAHDVDSLPQAFAALLGDMAVHRVQRIRTEEVSA